MPYRQRTPVGWAWGKFAPCTAALLCICHHRQQPSPQGIKLLAKQMRHAARAIGHTQKHSKKQHTERRTPYNAAWWLMPGGSSRGAAIRQRQTHAAQMRHGSRPPCAPVTTQAAPDTLKVRMMFCTHDTHKRKHIPSRPPRPQLSIQLSHRHSTTWHVVYTRVAAGAGGFGDGAPRVRHHVPPPQTTMTTPGHDT